MYPITTLLTKWQRRVAGTSYAQPPVYTGPNVAIGRFTEHSSEVQAGDCFVARVRTGTDGHPYIADAIARGASLILAQRPSAELGLTIPPEVGYLLVEDTAEALAWLSAAYYDFPSERMTVIGVTGTDGKTTTSTLLYEILVAAGYKTGMISTIKAVMGDREEPTGLHVSTPEAPEVQRYLHQMAEAGLTHCVLETTSHGLAQHRVTAVDYNVAVVTNITHEHLDYHGSYEGYLAAKRRLFEMVAQAAEHDLAPTLRALVLNKDDQSFASLTAVPLANQLHYAIYQPAHVLAVRPEYGARETQFMLEISGEQGGRGAEEQRSGGAEEQSAIRNPQSVILRSALVGEFNVYNMLAAGAAAVALGLDVATIEAGLGRVTAVSGRMERIDEGQNFLAMVDFAHTPNALEKALKATRPMVAAQNGKIIAVFGSAGKRDVEKRRMMAEISAVYADITVLTAEDPRTEKLADILEMMAGGCRLKGGREGDTFWRVPDRGEAIYFALTLARPQDVVIVCGKGHEQSMNFEGTEYPWDDRDATRAALRAFLAGQPMVDLGLPTFGGGGG